MNDPAKKENRPNLRTGEIMQLVQKEVDNHYKSELVSSLKNSGGRAVFGNTTILLAKEFGFCYGVERAIDLAYAAAKVFAGKRIFILGEIIHNPDVNKQINALGIRRLPEKNGEPDLSVLSADDAVILPAFGATASVVAALEEIGCPIVNTTCGDVMSVWKRVRQNARDSFTSVIHGKAGHEETRATASRATGNPDENPSHYLVVKDLQETAAVCDYIVSGGDPAAFLKKFHGAYSEGFHPDSHLKKIGIANQTTMLRDETAAVQNLLRDAIARRDGGDPANFRFFDTICGATQDRQNALREMLSAKPDLVLIVGGYNSSNTTHLVEIASASAPTFFIRDHTRILSKNEIRHFDLAEKKEIVSSRWLPEKEKITIGITAGASCPNNLIEDVIRTTLSFLESDTPLSPLKK